MDIKEMFKKEREEISFDVDKVVHEKQVDKPVNNKYMEIKISMNSQIAVLLALEFIQDLIEKYGANMIDTIKISSDNDESKV